MSELTRPEVAKLIDHALLRPTLNEQDLEAGIEFALRSEVASVCILPHYVKRCAALLVDSPVKVSTVIGFPHGANSSDAKLFEANDALDNGCEELDVVVNISRVLSGDWKYLHAEIDKMVATAHDRKQKIKVIFENCYLEDFHKIRLAQLCSELGADWIKTSTGFGTGGATYGDIELMRREATDSVQLKASGGISDLTTLLQYHALGVTRIGTSKTEQILAEARPLGA